LTYIKPEESLPFKEKRKVTDMVGAITANVYMLLIITVFVTRILGWPEI
jgi:hypothetical protein